MARLPALVEALLQPDIYAERPRDVRLVQTQMSFVFIAGDFVFSGDLVFKGAIGRSDLPNSDPAAMDVSLRKFLTWPDPLDVYPGHGPVSTVGKERITNPFLVRL